MSHLWVHISLMDQISRTRFQSALQESSALRANRPRWHFHRATDILESLHLRWHQHCTINFRPFIESGSLRNVTNLSLRFEGRGLVSQGKDVRWLVRNLPSWVYALEISIDRRAGPEICGPWHNKSSMSRILDKCLQRGRIRHLKLDLPERCIGEDTWVSANEWHGCKSPRLGTLIISTTSWQAKDHRSHSRWLAAVGVIRQNYERGNLPELTFGPMSFIRTNPVVDPQSIMPVTNTTSESNFYHHINIRLIGERFYPLVQLEHADPSSLEDTRFWLQLLALRRPNLLDESDDEDTDIEDDDGPDSTYVYVPRITTVRGLHDIASFGYWRTVDRGVRMPLYLPEPGPVPTFTWRLGIRSEPDEAAMHEELLIAVKAAKEIDRWNPRFIGVENFPEDSDEE